MTGIITTGSHPKALWPGVHAFVMGEYNMHPMEYEDIFDMEMSDMNYEEDVETTGFGLAQRKAETASTPYDSHAQGFVARYTHVAYGLGFIVTREEMDDNLYKSKAFKRGKQIAFSFRTTKEIVGANVLNRAFDSNFTGGDGVSLLNTAHPSVAGNYSNTLAVPADLTEASLEDLLIQIAEATNSRGLQIKVMGKCLIIPPALMFDAQRILYSTLQNNTDLNAVNAMKSMGMLPEGIKTNHYLTDNDAWFVKTDVMDGMRMFQRTPFEFMRDNDFDTGNAKAKGYERYSFGWTDPRGMYGSAGA